MRLAYVLPVGRSTEDPEAQLSAYPHNQRLLSTLAERHGLQCHAIWSSAHQVTLQRGAVLHHFTSAPIRAVRTIRPTVIHLNGLIFPRLTIALRAGVGRQPILVLQHHGELPGSGKSRLAQRAASRVVDRYLFCGLPGQADPWLRAGVLSRKTSLAEVLEASSDLVPGNTMPMATEDGDPNVIWVGRLQVGKDPLTGLEAFKRFSIHHPAARLTIVAPATRPLEAVLRDRLPAGARLIGPLTQAELGDCYARADIILSTSRHEGSGYAVIEAIGLGCTPALSELPSHRVIAGDLGHYFAPGNPVEAAEALERAFRASRATSARERARRHFETFLSWERVSDQLIAAWAHPRARTHSQQ